MVENAISTSLRPALDRARRRSAERAGVHRRNGRWGTDPVDLVASAAQRHPDAPALIDRDRRLDYVGLDRAVDGAAGVFARWGVGPGEPVLLVLANDVASVVAVHAALRLGAVALVVSSSAGAGQLADIASLSGATVGVAPPPMVASGGPTTTPGLTWFASTEVFTDADGTGVGGPVDPDEPVVVLFTSGTTARPKGVIHSLNTLTSASRNFAASARLGSDDSIFVLSPLASVTGVIQAITVAPLIGCTAVLETWDASATAELLLETAPTFFGGPDVLLDRLLDELERRGASGTSLQSVFVGGTMLDERILRRVDDAGIIVMRAYGSSEAPVSTTSGRDESREQRLADDGAPLDGVEVRAGSHNDPGECCISGPHVFLGYVDDEDDAGAFDDPEGAWYCTGDVADLSGGRVRVVGRIRDIVIRNGQKVPIPEVEAYLQRLPGVVRAAGYVVEDDATRERLAMAVIAEEGFGLDLARVGAALEEAGLARWKLPEELVLWDEPFPENATGKIVRDKVRAGSAGRPRVVAPRLEGRS